MESKTCFSISLFLLTLVLFSGCQQRSKEVVPHDMILIPAGEFIMGSDEVDSEMLAQRFGMVRPPFLNEHPKGKVHLDDYYIDKYEVTSRQYKEFINAISYKPPHYWVNGNYPAGTDDHPVFYVSWFNADTYCKWRGKRLPTEAEWEKAARGTDGRRFPWGAEFDQKKTNSLGLHGGTKPVGHFKEDVSPYGVFDVTGNVSEWTMNWYKPYPGNQYSDKAYGETYKVLRGGGWGGIGHYGFDFFYRLPFRNYAKPDSAMDDVGFRCVMSKK
ncbi:MAG: SUMF1/EgtB/PvdO family nonheme iron enzyme [Thermodesulfobacteriota bacterium]